MNKIVRISISALISCGLIAIVYNSFLGTDLVNKNLKIELTVTTDHPVDIDIFIQEDSIYKPELRLSKSYGIEVANQKVNYTLPVYENPGKIRIDPGTSRGKWLLHEIKLIGIENTIVLNADSIYSHFTPTKHIKDYKVINNILSFETTGPDPILESDFLFSKYLPVLNERSIINFKALLLAVLLGFFVFYFLNKRLANFKLKDTSKEKIFVLFFVLVIVLPFLRSTFFPKPRKEKNKYVEGTEAPVFSITNAISYSKQYSIYFDKNFGFREDLIFLNSIYKYKIYGTSSKPDLVAIGKKKWLFYVNHSNWGDYQNIDLFSESELEKIKNNLEELHTWHKNRGIKFYIMLVPNKSNIYPEYLPHFIKRKSEICRIEQLKIYLEKNSFVHLIDVMPKLLEAKKTTDVYYQNDTHWNTQAGFIATQTALDSMQKSFPSIPVPNSKNYKNIFINIGDPDLATHIGIERVLQNKEWMPIRKDQDKVPNKHKVVDSRFYISQYILMPTVTTEIPNDSLPKIVVYRDSFFGLLQPYFSESFRRCVYVWSTDITKEVIETEKPDIVFFEMIEGRIYKLLEENPEEIKNSMIPQ